MSDNQPEQRAEATPPAPPAGNRWGDPITPGRAAELKVLADQQRAWAAASDDQGQPSYFKGVPLTGAEVFWLAAYAHAGPTGDIDVSKVAIQILRLELTDLHLEGAILRGVHLETLYVNTLLHGGIS